MAKIKGTIGNDILAGTSDADEIVLTQGGNDTVSGGDGDDVFKMAAAFSAKDKLDGGTGIDRLQLSGDYSAGVVFKAATMTGFESLRLAGGHSYDLTTVDANIIESDLFGVHNFTFNAGALGAADQAIIDASAEVDTPINFIGGAGDDVLTGGQNLVLGNTYHLGKGGNDTVHGGAGRDNILMGHAFTTGDHLDGGNNAAGKTDILALDGKYSGARALTLADDTITNIAIVSLAAGHDYTLKIADGTFSGGMPFGYVYGNHLNAGDRLIFKGGLETDTKLHIEGGAGNDILIGGALDDQITTGTGKDVVKAGAGNDTIYVNGQDALGSDDQINGGDGLNTVVLMGDQTITLSGAMLKNIQNITASSNTNLDITMLDSAVAAGQSGNFDFSTASGTLHFGGSAESNAQLLVFGFSGDDTIVGGSQADILGGTAGRDSLTGGGGADTFSSTQLSYSQGSTYDTITDFAAGTDKIDLGNVPTGVDAQVSGHLDTASFDADMTTALSGHLQGNHAILFEASSGTLSGHTFLIVSSDGSAGYSASGDYVFDVTGGSNLAALSTADFV
jgi:Ca2+-binding RTX toxin-like protein